MYISVAILAQVHRSKHQIRSLHYLVCIAAAMVVEGWIIDSSLVRPRWHHPELDVWGKLAGDGGAMMDKRAEAWALFNPATKYGVQANVTTDFWTWYDKWCLWSTHDFYKIIGIDVDAPPEEVRRRCQTAMRSRGDNTHVILQAARVLKEENLRTVYDHIWCALHKSSHHFHTRVLQLSLDLVTGEQDACMIKASGLDGTELVSVRGDAHLAVSRLRLLVAEQLHCDAHKLRLVLPCGIIAEDGHSGNSLLQQAIQAIRTLHSPRNAGQSRQERSRSPRQ